MYYMTWPGVVLQIEAVVKQKEATARARKQFEQDRFESKQIMRKMMIQRVRTHATSTLFKSS